MGTNLLVGIDLITIEARVVVASIDTYLKYAEAGGPDTGRLATGSHQVQNRWKEKRDVE